MITDISRAEADNRVLDQYEKSVFDEGYTWAWNFEMDRIKRDKETGAIKTKTAERQAIDRAHDAAEMHAWAALGITVLNI